MCWILIFLFARQEKNIYGPFYLPLSLSHFFLLQKSIFFCCPNHKTCSVMPTHSVCFLFLLWLAQETASLVDVILARFLADFRITSGSQWQLIKESYGIFFTDLSRSLPPQRYLAEIEEKRIGSNSWEMSELQPFHLFVLFKPEFFNALQRI